MKIVHTFQKLISATAVICLAACGNRSDNSNSTTADSGATTKADTQGTAKNTESTVPKTAYVKPSKTESKFNDLRTMAFTVTPTELKITVQADKEVVYGVIFDQEIDGGTATLVSYQTGDASLYQNNGNSIIGGGSHANVSNVTKQFVALAQTFLDKCTKARTTSIPDKGMVKFYLLTTRGIYEADESMLNIKGHTSLFNTLYDSSTKVLTELKRTANTANPTS
jgi:hypothetical protein